MGVRLGYMEPMVANWSVELSKKPSKRCHLVTRLNPFRLLFLLQLKEMGRAEVYCYVLHTGSYVLFLFCRRLIQLISYLLSSLDDLNS